MFSSIAFLPLSPLRLSLSPPPLSSRSPRACLSRPPSPPPSPSPPNPSPSATTRAALWSTLSTLESRLARAVRLERYGDAARLRDRIVQLRATDEFVRVECEMQCAVAEERFLDAARLRDALRVLTPPPPPPSLAAVAGRGVDVEVSCWHMREFDESVGGEVRRLFGYRVRIRNGGDGAVQVVGRRWEVRGEGDGAGERVVEGVGVVARQPVVVGGGEFEYVSSCPVVCGEGVGRVVGSMCGQLSFVKGDSGEERFDVAVDRVYFVVGEDDAGGGDNSSGMNE